MMGAIDQQQQVHKMRKAGPSEAAIEALKRARELTEQIPVKSARARNGDCSGILAKINSRRRSSRTSKQQKAAK